MKTILIITLFLFFGYANSQSNDSFMEQTAFNFYKTELLPKNAGKQRLKITENLTSVHYISAECLNNKVYNEKDITPSSSLKYRQERRISLGKEKKLFKKVERINEHSNSESFVEISAAYKFKSRTFVVIHEFIKGDSKTYTFEFDDKGFIIDWCLSSVSERMIIH